MPIGMITLLVVGVLIYFGIGHRVLDRMHLSDKMALLVIGAMIAGSFLPDIPLGGGLAINIGGGVVPLLLAVYLLVKASTGVERLRAILAAVVIAAAIYFLGKVMPNEPGTIFIEPSYFYAVLAALVAYLIGRSRRAAFLGATVGILLFDLANFIIFRFFRGLPNTTVLGGGGAFDSVVLAGFLSVVLVEIVGETRERMQGGTAHPEDGDKEHTLAMSGMLGQAEETSPRESSTIDPATMSDGSETGSDQNGKADDNVIPLKLSEHLFTPIRPYNFPKGSNTAANEGRASAELRDELVPPSDDGKQANHLHEAKAETRPTDYADDGKGGENQ